MKINEIFSSIEGEGIRSGYPVTFIRLYGCNLKCSYCDTRYSCEGEEYTEMTLTEVVEEVKKIGIPRVTLTGGEPLLSKDADRLIVELLYAGFEVNIETNGSLGIAHYTEYPNIIITLDHKSISSGMSKRMNETNYLYLREQDVLKFVVGSNEDLEQMKKLIKSANLKCSIFVSPIFGKIQPYEIVDFILANKLNEARVQLQLHKMIWDPMKRGV